MEDTEPKSASPVASLPLPDGKVYHAFFCFNSANQEWVDETIAYLESPEIGFKCVNHKRDFLPGRAIETNIQESIAKSLKYVLVLTPEFLHSGWCKFETDIVLKMSIEQRTECIIPVLLKSCKIPDSLGILTYLDVVGMKPTDTWRLKLMESIGRTAETIPMKSLNEQPPLNDTQIRIRGWNYTSPYSTTKPAETWRIKEWTKSMVRTAALEKVMEKINRGATWVTIRGRPGEGKTTVAYMALEDLQDSGRQVFVVTSPEELSEVTKICTRPVIMLNDILGNLEFDPAKWQKWEDVLHEVLDVKDHRSHVIEPKEESNKRDGATVIFVGRENVLKSAESDMSNISKFFTEEAHVVLMSGDRSLEEKLSIWEAISKSSGVDLEENTLKEVCQIIVPHGFPHVCRLYATLRRDNPKLSAKDFFHKPLEFLNITVKKFMKNKHFRCLFKEMLKSSGDGRVSDEELETLDNGAEIKQVALDLVGTYLKEEDGFFMFDHPSIYDCVAYQLCTLESRFVIENCNLSFINERLRFKPSQDTSGKESGLVAYIGRDYMIYLAKRFAGEINNKQLSQVLSHKAFTDESFVRTMLSLNPDLDARDKMGMTVIHHLCDIGLSYCVKEAIEKGIRLDVKDGIGLSPLFYACMSNQIDVAKILLERGVEVDAESLVKACEIGNFHMVELLFEKGAKVEQRTFYGDTALHGACRRGHIEVISFLWKKGYSVNTPGVLGRSPLHEACGFNKPEVVTYLLDQGATPDCKDMFGNTPRSGAEMCY